MNSIKVKQEFNAPIDQVFDLLSKHATYNIAFSPVQVVRVKDSADPERPDGLGSIRRMGFGPIKPVQEQITLVDVNKRIEYKLINNPLIKHHIGILEFTELAQNKTRVDYTIELQARAPFVSKLILAQLKLAITLGFKKLAKSV
ncbi:MULTISPECIES: SRPBCC family protein [unclassified Acinetobacter]|uniref:SRPBCC family protein n=1 Tax=unclassified Acinetobacter TaxID=196816 RepID=UPI0025756E2E|nr:MULTISPECIES: SRPBCC family protein [unclassified Acinetobacter]MDM1763255.1 SRPBCC family protein [Acinetobacter sp. 226-1]MDM1766734.1 SRPBCC family protein [Acinetobacter sp. 226-4]